MLSFTHTLISLPFAVYLNNPVLIFLAAFVFHFFADTLLHWNIYPPQFKRYPFVLVAIEIGAGLIAAWLLTGEQFFTIPMWAAIIGGNLPDVIQGLWDFTPKKYQDKQLGWLKPVFVWHDKLQLETPSVAWGLLSQIILIAIAVALI
ncbi:MAG: hypothetical protein HYZ69_02310 [Candidatus Colwellbacteria bacterium]|nr:hypothetical protein [Candidatus Colwellbacteria bacterium]